MIIERGELHNAVHLEGREVLCLESWWEDYKVGATYKVLVCKYGVELENTKGSNRYDARWFLVGSDEELKVEDFI
jgi:hypothetical protein